MTGIIIEFSEAQQKKLQEFIDETNNGEYTGAIGGRYTYTITYTSLGAVVRCKDAVTKTEVDLTEYEYW